MHTRLDSGLIDAALSRIERSNRSRPRAGRARAGPVHTLRIDADAFRHDSVRRAGARALRLLQSYAPDSVVLALALRLPGFEALPTDPGRVDALLGRLESGDPTVPPAAQLAHDVYRAVYHQLAHAPVQDLRIDLAGYDPHRRSDEDEDGSVGAAATEAAIGLREGMLCPRFGIRIPALSGTLAGRALRTLDLFVSTLSDRASGALSDRFVVTVPAVTHEDQVSAMVQVLGALETRLSLQRGSIGLELGLVPAGAYDEGGSCRLPTYVAASGGRCVGVRIDPPVVAALLGTRDPNAAVALRDVARLALAATPTPISWGTSPALPRSHGERGAEQAQRFAGIHAAWRAHAAAVLQAAHQGYTWGVDTDAGQIPARLAALATFYRQNLDEIRAGLIAASRAGVAADPLLIDEVNVGVDCGALSEDDLEGTGFEPSDFSWWNTPDRDDAG